MDGPAIAIVRSPRDWARSLHRYVADYGGAVVRARPLEERQALEEVYDVLLIDDISSFLTHRLIQELHRLGRRVIGVYDNNDIIGGYAAGRERLDQMGIDATIETNASPEDFLRLIQSVTPAETHETEIDQLIAEFRQADGFVDTEFGDSADSDDEMSVGSTDSTDETHLHAVEPSQNQQQSGHSSGKLTLVLSTSGGAGSTEVAIELARIVRARGEVGVLIDADDVSPSIAQRLGLPLHPNIRTAIDAVEHNLGRLADCVVAAPGNQTTAITGLPHPKDWMTLRPEEVLAVTQELSRVCHHVIVNASGQLDDLAGVGGIDRFGVSRILVEEADRIVLVGWATPVGVARILDRAAEIQNMADGAAIHVILNRAPNNNFLRGELLEEVQRTFVPKGLHFISADKKVEEAAWEGRFVTSGPFSNAMAEIALSVLGAQVSSKKRRMKKAG